MKTLTLKGTILNALGTKSLEVLGQIVPKVYVDRIEAAVEG